MFCVVQDNSCSKLNGKKYKQNTLLKSHKNEVKLLPNPGLALESDLNNPIQKKSWSF